MARAWVEATRKYLTAHGRACGVGGGLGSISRILRMILQSAVFGVGAYLVIYQESTAGIIIAGSILTARALAPVELAIANWKGFVGTRQSGRRLDQLLKLLPKEEELLTLPPPTETLSVAQVHITAPGSDKI